MSEEEIIGLLAIFGGLLGLAVGIFVAYLLWDGLSRIPKENRTVEPYFAWLTLIPLAGIVFLWILLPFKIPESLRSYFASQERDSPNLDYGKAHGLGTMISYSCIIIPFINFIAWIPALVFLILYLIQFRGFAQQLPPRMPNIAANQGTAPLFASTPQRSNTNTVDRYGELEKLKKLLDDGVLSQEEFETEKRRILDSQ
jgi:hypothetical protein